MKKSVEILGLPIISITEGRELGLSKSLLIDAKNGLVAAITIEDDDWYRGVKLIPYESVIAIGADAVTITHSENILKLEDAGDYEALLDENIRVIGTRAITKNGIIQGTVTEIFVGDDGRIEKCEITAPDGIATEVTAEQISIFGKQVTVIESELEKKTELISPYIEEEPDHYAESTEDNAADSFYGAEKEPAAEPAVEESFIPEPEPAAASFSQPEVHHALIDEPEPEPAELESMMTPEPKVEELPTVEEVPTVEEEPAPVVEELPTVEEEPAPAVEEVPTVEEPAPMVEELPTVEEPAPVVEELPTVEEEPAPAVEEIPTVEEVPTVEELPTVEEEPAPVVEELPTVEEPAPVVEELPTVEEPAPAVEELPTVEEPAPAVEEIPTLEEPAPAVEEIPTVEEPAPMVEEVTTVEEPAPVVEEIPTVEEPAPAVEEVPTVEEPAPAVEEIPTVEEPAPAVEEPSPIIEPTVEPIAEQPIIEPPVEEAPAPSMSELASNAPEPAPVEETPAPSNIVEMPLTTPVAPPVKSNIVEMPVTGHVDPPAPVEESRVETLEQVTRHKTQQAEILRAALRKAMAKQAKNKSVGEAATVADRLQIRRSMFLGKHATATIKTDNGIAIVEEGAEITEAVFQKARLANKLTELSKNIQ